MLRRALTIALAGLLGGCAASEKELRSAWNEAIKQKKTGADEAGEGAENDTDSNDPNSDEEQLAAYLERITARLAEGLGALSVPGLVADICDGQPDRDPTPDGVVYHCVPEPSQSIGDTALTVEISPAGIVSVTADDLSELLARQLVRHSIELVRPLCEATIAPANSAQNAREDFHTCITQAGVTYVVGRFKVSEASTRWRFSLALLGPG